MRPRLHDYALSASCYKVRLLAALLDTRLDVVAVDFHPGREHKTASFLTLNPAGTLPVLEADGTVMTDTADMLRWLARTHDAVWLGDGTRVQPWLDMAIRLNESLGMARLHDMLHADCDIGTARKAGVADLRRIEAHLWARRQDGEIFLAGPRATIADIACFPNVALAPDGGVNLDPYPSIRLWMRAVRSLPRFVEMPGIHRLHELSPVPDYAAASQA